MTRICRIPVEDKVLQRLYFLLFEVVNCMDEEESFSEIINELLSPTERIMVAKRVAIIYLLMKKINYENIADVLKVAPATIAKFHKIMIENGSIKKALKGIVANEKVKDFLEKLYLEFRGPGTYGVNWGSAWRQKNEFERRKVKGI